MRNTPTAALKTLLNLPRLHFIITRDAWKAKFRLENSPSLKGSVTPEFSEYVGERSSHVH